MAATAYPAHRTNGTPQSLNRLTFTAAMHCLTGCAIGEVLGVAIGATLRWSDPEAVALAVGVSFVLGYSLYETSSGRARWTHRAVARRPRSQREVGP